MRSRLRQLGASGVQVKTFHAAALSQLEFFWPQYAGVPAPQVLESKARLVADAASELKIKLDTADIRELAAEIEWRKYSMLDLDGYAAVIDKRPKIAGVKPEQNLALQALYEENKVKSQKLDWEDVLILTLGLLRAEPLALSHVHQQYRFFTVDEYKDIYPLQHALLDCWMGDHTDLCVVGDPNQTIYSFAGASSEHLLRFGDDFPNAITVTLDRNYRSTPEIVHLANSLVPDSPLELVSTIEGGLAPQLRSVSTDADEARAIAASIAANIAAGTKPEDIAILYRINSQSVALEAALAAAGVPFRVRGSRFFEEQTVRETMLILRGTAATNPTMTARDALGMILREHFNWVSKPPANPIERHSWNVLAAVQSLAEALPDTATAADLLADLTQRAEADVEPTVNAVTLSTIHAAKGLEWDTVYIAGVSEGLLPLSFATDDAAIAEERRLLYVAVTRARSALTLSWAERGANQSSSRTRSRFIPAALAATDTRTAGERRAGE